MVGTAAPVTTVGDFEASPEAARLLAKYNPVLLMFPQERDRERPGRYYQGDKGRGDYHPCPVELFLRHAALHSEVRKKKDDRSHYVGSGVQVLKDELRKGGDTTPWELDNETFSRHNATQAWGAYHDALDAYKAEGHEDWCAVYGRATLKSNVIALQYWYFYVYNDAANKHEGDWETITILLQKDPNDPTAEPEPFLSGYAGHAGGIKRPWRGVSRAGGRPLAYVARGSHAAYLEDIPFGYHVAHIEMRKERVPGWRQAMYNIVFGLPSRFLFFLGVRDYTAPLDSHELLLQGVRVEPTLKVIPQRRSRAEDLDTEWWWLHLDCPWGSSRPAVGPMASEFLAPDPPWTKGRIWEDPVLWAMNLRPR